MGYLPPTPPPWCDQMTAEERWRQDRANVEREMNAMVQRANWEASIIMAVILALILLAIY
jgi:hypothetical protein